MVLVAYAGRRHVYGFQGAVMGPLDAETMSQLDRRAYAEMYGPTTGDRVRLADTDLWAEVEDDRTIYGEEVRFGGGKVIRDGMGQSQAGRAEAVDTVITNALIVDHWGIVKADIGLKDGRIERIGKAGNPDTQPGVDIVIGPGTEVIAGEGRIATAGGHRRPRPLHRAPTGRGRADVRHHDDAGRRHRPGDRHERDDLHARARGTWRACSRPRMRCRSTSASWARATPACRSRSRSRCGLAPSA